MSALIEADELVVHYPLGRKLSEIAAGRARRVVRAVNGVSLRVGRGEALGIVGESGCGKSTLGRALLRLTPATRGTVRFDGQDIAALGGADLIRFRRRAQIVFQDPHAALNPRLSVRQTLTEVLRVHDVCPSGEVGHRIHALMDRVGLSAALAERRAGALSGGQCQRVGIARALALGPELLIADECVSALDVSIQAQVLNLLLALQADMGLALVFISHDLGVVRHLCQRVAIMYLGRIVEEGPAEVVLRDPRHPYTRALIASVPGLDGRRGPRVEVSGEPPSAIAVPAGCAFHPRCPEAMPVCSAGAPPAWRGDAGHGVRCHLYAEGQASIAGQVRLG